MDDKELREQFGRLGTRIEQVLGRVQKSEAVFERRFAELEAQQETRFAELHERIDAHHDDQMRKFQSVITEAERIGSVTAHDARLAEHETRLRQLELAIGLALQKR